MKRAVLFLVAAVVIVFVIVPAQASGTAEKVTFAYGSSTSAVLARLALLQGYYQKEGLDVTPRLHSFGKSALQDMLEGKADFATVAAFPIVMAIMKGEKISIIATIQTSNKNIAIVARKDAGIRSPADLKGKKIAATLGTASDFFMDAFLIARGIGGKNVEKVDRKPELMQDALMKGHVDAASVFDPYLIQIQKKLGDRVVSFYDENIYTWTFNVVAKQEFIRKNPEKVKRLLHALVRAEDFVKENPVQAQRIAADYSKVDIDMVREIWARMSFKVTLDQFLVLALEDESRWAISSGRIARQQIPNYLNFIYFDGLESVKPKTVRILR